MAKAGDKVRITFPDATPNAHILIGGVPYPAYLPPEQPEGMPAGVTVAYLWEAVGKKGEITRDEATTYFGEGTGLFVKWRTKDNHPTTGFPLLEITKLPQSH
jgi:hypothetical protein